MGGAQSTTAGSGAGQGTAEVKTSYYELLGVERSATDEELKKAYRRKALELHPDRNYGNVESATRLFAEVQSAYEVLSDPQERAWYDSHESAILRGEDGVGDTAEEQVYEGNLKVTTADDIARMIRKFNSNVSFTDAPSGFFGYLRETFEHLAKEEQVAVQWEGGDAPDYPSFGHKDDNYEDVVKPFYSVWLGFATRKSFKWKDRYRLSEAPDRRYRRLMEKENQKLREEGIREFNEAVRSLVAFIRKRDPRYIPTQQSEEERQKILRDAAAAQAARARKQNEERLKGEVPEWAQVVQKDDLDGEIEESESEEEHYECVACRKTFKSEKQWEAHEKSKKHQKAVYALRKKMQKDNKHLDLDETGGETGGSSLAAEDDANETQNISDVETKANDLNLEEESTKHRAHDTDGVNGEGEEQGGKEDAHEDEEEQNNEEDAPEVEEEQSGEGNVHGAGENHDSASDSSDSDYASTDAIKARLASSPEEAPQMPQPKQGKAALKRAKKAAAAAAAREGSAKEFTCAVCGNAFPSKTRMFQHVKDFGHAAPKTVTGGKGKKGKR